MPALKDYWAKVRYKQNSLDTVMNDHRILSVPAAPSLVLDAALALADALCALSKQAIAERNQEAARYCASHIRTTADLIRTHIGQKPLLKVMPLLAQRDAMETVNRCTAALLELGCPVTPPERAPPAS